MLVAYDFFSLSSTKVVAFTDGYAVNTTLSSILQDLENITATYSVPKVGNKSSQMYQRDMKTSVDALSRLIKYNAVNKNKPLSNQKNINNLVKASSNLLRITNLPAWKKSLEVNTIHFHWLLGAMSDTFVYFKALKTYFDLRLPETIYKRFGYVFEPRFSAGTL